MVTDMLVPDGICVDAGCCSKEEAIRKAGELLVKLGYVKEEYIQAMFEREEVLETYIGNNVAIPHGICESKDFIQRSGIVMFQYRKPIDYGGSDVNLLFGIAGKDNEHIKILSSICIALSDIKNVERITHMDSKLDIIDTFMQYWED